MLLIMDGLFKKYALSFILFIVSIAILIWQFVFPDPVPDIMKDLIAKAHPEQIGLKPSMQAFLFVYTWSGLISFIGGIVNAVIVYFKSISE
jgi:hypothetical protein